MNSHEPRTRSSAPPRTTRELLGLRWVWSLGGLTVAELSRRVQRAAQEDDILGRAAQLSFYFFLSLFPLLIFTSAVAGQVLESNLALHEKLLEYLSEIMPVAAFEIIQDALADITARGGAGEISLGLGFALWTGSAAMAAIIEGLNIAYSVREFRSWWKRRLVAMALTVTFLVLGLSALVLVLLGGQAEEWLRAVVDGPLWFWPPWTWGQWLIVLSFMLIVFNLIYLLAPNLKEQRWQAIMPGSIVALLGWLLSSLGLKWYLVAFDSFSATYGTLGAVIALLLWLYTTGVAILVGGEVNSEIRRAAAGNRGARFAR